jgi:hypothetical protein
LNWPPKEKGWSIQASPSKKASNSATIAASNSIVEAAFGGDVSTIEAASGASIIIINDVETVDDNSHPVPIESPTPEVEAIVSLAAAPCNMVSPWSTEQPNSPPPSPANVTLANASVIVDIEAATFTTTNVRAASVNYETSDEASDNDISDDAMATFQRSMAMAVRPNSPSSLSSEVDDEEEEDEDASIVSSTDCFFSDIDGDVEEDEEAEASVEEKKEEKEVELTVETKKKKEEEEALMLPLWTLFQPNAVALAMSYFGYTSLAYEEQNLPLWFMFSDHNLTHTTDFFSSAHANDEEDQMPCWMLFQQEKSPWKLASVHFGHWSVEFEEKELPLYWLLDLDKTVSYLLTCWHFTPAKKEEDWLIFNGVEEERVKKPTWRARVTSIVGTLVKRVTTALVNFTKRAGSWFFPKNPVEHFLL